MIKPGVYILTPVAPAGVFERSGDRGVGGLGAE